MLVARDRPKRKSATEGRGFGTLGGRSLRCVPSLMTKCLSVVRVMKGKTFDLGSRHPQETIELKSPLAIVDMVSCSVAAPIFEQANGAH